MGALVQTRAVLADAYTGRNRSLQASRLLTHAVEVDEETWQPVRVICGRVALDAICDIGALDDETMTAPPTCERCARHDPRRYHPPSPPLVPLPVVAMGHKPSRVLIHGALVTLDRAVYPESPQGRALRALRRGMPGERYLKVYEAAPALGVTSVQLGELEAGEATLSPEDWTRAMSTLAILRG